MKSAGNLLAGRRTRSVENVHRLGLMALLRDLVRDMGTTQAAEALGVDRKTVWRGMSAGRLSPRLTDALERLLLEEGVADSARQRREQEELCRRMEAFEEEMRGDFETLSREHARTRRLVERVVGHMGVARGGKSDALVPGGHGRRDAMVESRREYPELVTREPADDDEEVYAEAWPLVYEWRRLELRREMGTKLDRALTRERIMALEIGMIEDHGLTLPPATSPMHPSEREIHLDWRRRALVDLRWERAKLVVLGRVRRVLTFGLWGGLASSGTAAGSTEAGQFS